MRIILRYSQAWGQLTTFTLDLEESISPKELLDKIAEKIYLKKLNFICRLKRDGYMVK